MEVVVNSWYYIEREKNYQLALVKDRIQEILSWKYNWDIEALTIAWHIVNEASWNEFKNSKQFNSNQFWIKLKTYLFIKHGFKVD